MPTGLEEGDEVWLVAEDLVQQGTLSLGAHQLGGVGGARRSEFCVTQLLAHRNQIRIELPGAEELALDATIQLEIRQ